MGFYKELGDRLEQWLKEKIKVVDTKVESIAKYHKYLNTELEYCQLSIVLQSDLAIQIGTIIPFNTIKNNNGMKINTETCSIWLKANKTYKISADYTPCSGMVNTKLYNITDNTAIATFMKSSSDVKSTVSPSNCSTIYSPNNDCEIQIRASWIYNTPSIKTNNLQGYFIVEEINRQIVIDPVEHVNSAQGIEDTPVGHIISHMGTVAPKHYLICDGTEYNIEDYPYLAQHIEDNFGSISYFGGDGKTTFAVPDLRGEFLRGTGTGVRDTGSGANVGIHQDATEIPNIGFNTQGKGFWIGSSTPEDGNVSIHVTQVDKYIQRESTFGYGINNATSWNSSGAAKYTSRPTNTSVLYCIKYEPTYFMNTYNTNYMQPSMYSLEERIVGCWIDGKPLYQKTIVSTIPETEADGATVLNTITTISDGDYILLKESYYKQGSLQGTLPTIDTANNTVSICLVYSTNQEIIISNSIQRYNNRTIYIVVEYTKTTDAENSFTPDMLSNISTLNTTASDEEVNEVIGGI